MSIEVMSPRSGTVAGELASGVMVEGDTVYDFVVHEMTGVEEDLLAGKGPIMPRLNQVILNCITSIGGTVEKKDLGPIVRALTSVDRMILLIAIRRASLGDMYDLKYSCPSCKGSNDASVNLASLEINKSQVAENTHSITLQSGRRIDWHTMTGIDEEWLQSQQKRQQRLGQSDLLTLAMLTRIDAIDGESLDRNKDLKGSVTRLKSLRLSERNEIREMFKGTEGSIDTELEFECQHCGHEFSSELDVGQVSFFFPSGI